MVVTVVRVVPLLLTRVEIELTAPDERDVLEEPEVPNDLVTLEVFDVLVAEVAPEDLVVVEEPDAPIVPDDLDVPGALETEEPEVLVIAPDVRGEVFSTSIRSCSALRTVTPDEAAARVTR